MPRSPLTNIDYEILIRLGNSSSKNISKLKSEINCVYSHVQKRLNIMEQRKLIITQRVGRERKIILSKKGMALSIKIKEMRNIMKESFSYDSEHLGSKKKIDPRFKI